MNIEVTVRDGQVGDYCVETFVVSIDEATAYNLRASFRDRRYITAGTYKRLVRVSNSGIDSRLTIMSNTPSEISDHTRFIFKAVNSEVVLINGLGLGVALTKILKSTTVKKITVVEISEDVINLVGPTFTGDPRVEIIHADAMEYKPPRGSKYDVVWHDIWDDICGDNLEQMKILHRRYGRRTTWQGSWCRDECAG